MISPRPPPPAIAAIVAVAITKMAAIRIPAKTSGSASGSSTRRSICVPVIPIPRAASTTSRSTPSTPKKAFVRIGGTASTTRATVLFQKPIPKIVSPNAISTRLGRARPRFDALIAMNEPRWRCPSQTPMGSATKSAIPSAAPESSTCWSVLCASRSTLSAMKRNASTKVPGLN